MYYINTDHKETYYNFETHQNCYVCSVTKEVAMETKIRGLKICSNNGFGIIHMVYTFVIQ